MPQADLNFDGIVDVTNLLIGGGSRQAATYSLITDGTCMPYLRALRALWLGISRGISLLLSLRRVIISTAYGRCPEGDGDEESNYLFGSVCSS